MIQTIFAITVTIVALPLFIALANVIFVEAPVEFIKKLSNHGNH